MTPYEASVLNWEQKPRDHPLAWYEEVHKRHGFVFSTPGFYVMGRPVLKYAAVERILDVEHVFDFSQCDTWFIFWMQGEASLAWRILPWELPWMCWQRGARDGTDDLQFFETRRLMRLCGVEPKD